MVKIHPSTEEAIQIIDAALYSGDSFHNKENLEYLETYFLRWSREAERIKKHDFYESPADEA